MARPYSFRYLNPNLWIIGLALFAAGILGFLVTSLEYQVIFLVVGLLAGLLALCNAYIGAFLVIIIQPIFIASWQEAGAGFTKVIYGALFAVWFGGWFFSKLAQQNFRASVLWHPVARPALAFGGVLALSLAVGHYFGATPENMVRDLSPYVGYLAVLPVLDAVRTRPRAKKLLTLMAVIGLPCFLLAYLVWTSRKLGLEYGEIPFLTYGGSYWAPFQGAMWAVALAATSFSTRFCSWAWLMFTAIITVIGGYRGSLITFFIGGGTAFFLSCKLGREQKGRFLIPFFLIMTAVGIFSGITGIIKLPLPEKAMERYSTLLSKDNLVEDPSVRGRILETEALMETFWQSPIVGKGLGYEFTYIWIDGKMTENISFRRHNGYAESLMKFGVLGTIIFLWYIASIIFMSYNILLRSDIFITKVLCFGMIVWLTSALIGSLSGSAFPDRGFALTVGVMAGLLPALNFKDEKSAYETPRKVRHFL
jgi:hypothetical protein